MGMSADQLKDAIDNATPASADDVMAATGLTPEDLAAMGKGGSGSDLGTSYAQGSAGADRSPASTTGSSLDSLFAKKDLNPGSGVVLDKDGKPQGLSPDVKAALDRNGITGLTLFQMVSSQYKRKTPMMFGVPAKTAVDNPDNPFGDLNKGEKIKF
jgi:hypothetical protein